VEALIGMLTATQLGSGQLQFLLTSFVDGFSKDFHKRVLIETSTVIVEVKHVSQVAPRETGNLLVVHRPILESPETFGSLRSESTVVQNALVDDLALVWQ